MSFVKRAGAVLPKVLVEMAVSIYHDSEKFLSDADGIIVLTKEFFLVLPRALKRRREILHEMIHLGYDSALIVVITIAFLGVIMVLETSYHITLVISDLSMLPGVVSKFAIMEAGSTVTALIVICRICPGITSEIALLKETEQLDAYRMIGLNVIEFHVLPKVVAVFITLLAISVLSTFTALLAAWITCMTHLDMPLVKIFHSFNIFVSAKDFLSPFVRVLVYAFSIPIVASHHGLSSGGGATEIGTSATKSIVFSGVLIITLDFIITWIFNYI